MNVSSVAAEREQRSRSDGFWAPGCRACRCGRSEFGGWPSACHLATESTADGFGDDEGGYQGTGDPDSFDDPELEAAVREFIGALIELLEPRYVEVVSRAELLDQPAFVIAREMNLSEQTVIECLEAGRRDLLRLIALTPHRSLED